MKIFIYKITTSPLTKLENNKKKKKNHDEKKRKYLCSLAKGICTLKVF